MSVDPAVIAAWTRGWTYARETPPPTLDRGGWRVEVGWPDQVRRWVFPALEGGPAEVAASLQAPLQLLKVPAAPEEVAACLPRPWSVERTGTFMTCAAPLPASPPPPGYRLHQAEIAHGVAVELSAADGALAGHGRAVAVDGMIVFDRIRVGEAHRRLGLARSVMGALDAALRARGARTAALTSTDMGRPLYEGLGFAARAPWTTAQIPA